MKKIFKEYYRVVIFYAVIIVLSVGVLNRLDNIKSTSDNAKVIYESELAVK